MTKKEPTTLAVLPPQQMARKRQWLAILSPYQASANALTIENEDDYRAADFALCAVQRMSSGWELEMEELLEPARKLKQGLDTLKRSVAQPLDMVTMTIKDKMRDYKLVEQRQVREAQIAHERERARLEEEKAKKEQALQNASTQKMRERIAAARQELEVKADNLAYQGSGVAPIQADNSSTRTLKKVRVNNYDAFVEGVLQGLIPVVCLSIVQAELNLQFKARPEVVEGWPGVEVYEDVIIATRRG